MYISIDLSLSLYIYIYIYIYTHTIHVEVTLVPRFPSTGLLTYATSSGEVVGGGTTGVSTNGVTADVVVFVDRGTFDSGPISVDPICPQPRSSRGAAPW